MTKARRKRTKSGKPPKRLIDWKKNVALEADRYAYRVQWSDEDREYVGLCAELPSLSWLAKTPDAALKGIRRLVADAIAEMAGSGETPPQPFALRRYSGKFLVRVPPETHRRLAIEAAEEGVSLNRLASAKLSR
jgi:predicted HicB family RNase H-like nuclease